MIASLSQLSQLFRHHGAIRLYAKKLAPNDNSKNQVYLGGDFSALNIIPHSDVLEDASDLAGSTRDRAKAKVRFYWVGEQGKFLAPDAQLILYPKYPEVRMSGFLKGCPEAPSSVMTIRDEGRVLFLGITRSGEVLGYAADANDPAVIEFHALDWDQSGVFLEIPFDLDPASSSRTILIGELRRIHERQWIPSQKLSRAGIKTPYQARNGGGYTLEAELGISPNSLSEPDFMGWEVKQYGVRDFNGFAPKSPVTLMTPEPTGGFYKTGGYAAFLTRYGYSDRSGKEDRINFGGVYRCDGALHPLTGLRLALNGFDAATAKIDLEGSLVLLTANDDEAASWSFKGMMAHWNRKHAQAAYVPSIFRDPPPEYSYGSKILLCERTDFLLLMKAVSDGTVYYDPGIKMENASGLAPVIKRRSQFRIRHEHLTKLYHEAEETQVT